MMLRTVGFRSPLPFRCCLSPTAASVSWVGRAFQVIVRAFMFLRFSLPRGRQVRSILPRALFINFSRPEQGILPHFARHASAVLRPPCISVRIFRQAAHSAWLRTRVDGGFVFFAPFLGPPITHKTSPTPRVTAGCSSAVAASPPP